MVTVFEEYATEEQRSVVRFCGQKDSIQRIFTMKCFLFTPGSIHLIKGFRAGSRNFHPGGKRFADDEEVETEWGSG
jgi:hypothetical protein